MNVLAHNQGQAKMSLQSRSRPATTALIIPVKLVVLSAIGLFFGDLLLFRIGGFPVTFYHLLLPLSAVMTSLSLRWTQEKRIGLIATWLLIVIIELVHVVISGYSAESEWHRSLAQFLLYSISFLAIAHMELGRAELTVLGPWVAKLGLVLGSAGIIQFVLFMFRIPAYLPAEMRVNPYWFDPLVQTYRYGGFSPAIGLATEPSHYALALCVLFGCVIFFAQIGVLSKRLRVISTAVILFAILLSYSIAGIVISTLLLVFSAMASTKRRSFWFVILGAFLCILLGLSFVQPIMDRLSRVVEGADNSSQMRVVASMKLLFAGTSKLETAILGTGLGLETREYVTYVREYSQVMLSNPALLEIKVHNIFAVIKLMQGWVGLMLYAVMIWLTLRPALRFKHWHVPTIIFFLLYQFSTGLYLTPAFWSVYALMAVLWQSDLTWVVRNADPAALHSSS